MAAAAPRILVVDDDAPVLRFLSRALAASRLWAPVPCSGPEEALQAFAEGGADAAVIDALLGGGAHGADLIAAIRSSPAGARLPIAALSAYGPEQLRRCRDSGADVCRYKPAVRRELLDAVSAAVRERRETEELAGARILLVEDDPEAAALMRTWLEAAPPRYRFEAVAGVRAALRRLKDEPPQLVVLDLTLSDGDGLEVLKALRAAERPDRLPVLVQTASAAAGLSAKCLEDGADDFVTKPLNHGEFLARVRALLRRSGWTAQGQGVLSWGPLTLDNNGHDGLSSGRKMGLSELEFRLLKPLFEAKGGLVLAGDLVRDVLGVTEPGVRAAAYDALRVHMSNLRKKFGPHRRLLRNRKGLGYFLAPVRES